MILSYYAARANLYHLWQLHPDWDHAAFAAAIGSSKGWVKKWLKRFREERTAGVPVEQILQGHSRGRKHAPLSTHPLVVDPFAGGGAIPLEALRVGADAFASDLNPVAVLLNKVVLEYIPTYGQRLADEVRRWGA